MSVLKVAVVARDPAIRAAIAECFDQAPKHWSVALLEEPPSDADVVVRGPDVSAEADVVFDPRRPETLLDQIRGTRTARAKVFVVTGAGRGVGVTSAALHLARSLSAGAETCFLDLDATWKGAGDRLGMEGRTTKTWADCGSTPEELRLAALPVAGGFRALLAPGEIPPPEDLLGRIVASFARVVVDLPAGEPFDVPAETRAVLLLVPPTPSGIARARAILTRAADAWTVVVSRTGHGGELRRAEVEARLGRKVILELPCTPTLRDAEDAGRLLNGPWSAYNRRVARLATWLEAL